MHVAVAIAVLELGQPLGMAAVDDAPLAVDGLALVVEDQVQGMGVDEVQGGAAVAQGGHGLELDGIRIRRARGQLPGTFGEAGIAHGHAGEVAHAPRGALPGGVVDLQLPPAAQVVGAHRQPGHAPLREAGGELVPAAAVGDADGQRGARAGGGGARAGDLEVQDVAQAFPGQPRLLDHRSAAVDLRPVGVVVGARLVGGAEAEHRELGIGLDRALVVHAGPHQRRHVAVAPHEVMGEVGPLRRALGGRGPPRRYRRAADVQGLGGARLAVVLLHVAGLAVALELRIEGLVAGAVRVAAAQPLGVGPLDGEPPHPLAQAVLDRERVGHVVAGAAQLGARQ